MSESSWPKTINNVSLHNSRYNLSRATNCQSADWRACPISRTSKKINRTFVIWLSKIEAVKLKGGIWIKVVLKRQRDSSRKKSGAILLWQMWDDRTRSERKKTPSEFRSHRDISRQKFNLCIPSCKGSSRIWSKSSSENGPQIEWRQEHVAWLTP